MKKFASAVLSILMVFSFVAMPTLASADAPLSGKCYKTVDCKSFNPFTGILQYSFKELQVMFIVEAANAQIDFEIFKAKLIANHRNVDRVIKQLIASTEEISLRTAERCYRLGAIVECEYVAVTICGKTVMIDPIRIISFSL